MSNPKFSIIMPCLNAVRFLQPRVDSLLRQTETNWQAIVLDSRSTDGSWEFFKAVAEKDPRFVLHQVPREGLYAALNYGIELADGEFLHIATCDDTMHPQFLAVLSGALRRYPNAGIAASDVMFIDADGKELPPHPLFGSGRVRTATNGEISHEINYRPAPHDCCLHLAGGTVYFSLTQLLVRTNLARAAPRFDAQVGSIADFGWSLNLTNLAGTVHIPQRYATWRFHGDQLSLQTDDNRQAVITQMCTEAASAISRSHSGQLSNNDLASLLIPAKLNLAKHQRRFLSVAYYLQAIARLLCMVREKPAATLSALGESQFRYGNLKHSWIALILRRAKIFPILEVTPTSGHGPMD